MKSTLILIIAGPACLLTFLVTRRILHEHLKIGPPSLMAGLVAGLAFLGLTTAGEGIASVLLIPYAALALALLALFLWVTFGRLAKRHLNRGRTSGTLHQWGSKHSETRLRAPTPCSKPAGTRRRQAQQNPESYERH